MLFNNHQCVGDCKRHSGPVRQAVILGDVWNSVPQWYCKAAVEADRQNGLIVFMPGERERWEMQQARWLVVLLVGLAALAWFGGGWW